MKGCKSQDSTSQSRQKPHKPAKSRKSQNATCRRGTGNAEDAKSQSQKATKTCTNQQKAEKPRSREAKKPRNRKAKKPRSQKAKKPRSQEAKSEKKTIKKKKTKINTPPLICFGWDTVLNRKLQGNRARFRWHGGRGQGQQYALVLDPSAGHFFFGGVTPCQRQNPVCGRARI